MQLLALCYSVVVFLLVIFSKDPEYTFSYYFISALYSREVRRLRVGITPWQFDLHKFGAERLFLGGKQTE